MGEKKQAEAGVGVVGVGQTQLPRLPAGEQGLCVKRQFCLEVVPNTRKHPKPDTAKEEGKGKNVKKSRCDFLGKDR